MAAKKYDEGLIARVMEIRKGLGPQPLAMLWAINEDFRMESNKYRRILSGKCHPGDASYVEAMETAKKKLLVARR